MEKSWAMQHAQKQSSSYVAVLKCNANFWPPATFNSTEINGDEFMNVDSAPPITQASPGKVNHPDSNS